MHLSVGLLYFVFYAEAFPIENNPKIRSAENLEQLQQKVNATHRPVLILLYASWCGHCVNFKPDFIKFANNMGEVVEVYAVDAHQNSSFGSFYKVKGFPSIVYYHCDKKRPWQPYTGQRTLAGLSQHVLNLIPSYAKMLESGLDLEKLFIHRESNNRAVFLFTEKRKIPPLFNLIGGDPEFLHSLPFFVVPKDLAERMDALKTLLPSSFPCIAILSKSEDVDGALRIVATFSGNITFANVTNFIKDRLLIGRSNQPEQSHTNVHPYTRENAEKFCSKGFCVICCDGKDARKDGIEKTASRYESDNITFLVAEDITFLKTDFEQILQDVDLPFVLLFKRKNGILKYHISSLTAGNNAKGGALNVAVENFLTGNIELKRKKL